MKLVMRLGAALLLLGVGFLGFLGLWWTFDPASASAGSVLLRVIYVAVMALCLLGIVILLWPRRR